MDDVDRKILAALQQDGRLTITELAERVRLSLSPCHRRLRALERSGAISGYRAHLDAHALGLTFEALVFVTMRDAKRDTLAAFERATADIPHVLQAQRLFGDPDYLLRILTPRPSRLPTALRRPPRRTPRRTTPQQHPRHEKHRRKPTPATLSRLQTAAPPHRNGFSCPSFTAGAVTPPRRCLGRSGLSSALKRRNSIDPTAKHPLPPLNRVIRRNIRGYR